jgi:hypothetical protein
VADEVTILIVPRDRFSSVVECARSILDNTEPPFHLSFLDLGYDRATLATLRDACHDVSFEIVPMHGRIPMEALRQHVGQIRTQYVAWVDNDTFVTKGWLKALVGRARQGARVALPVTLEREGLGTDPRSIPLRNHISHSELRVVSVGGKDYLFDHKPFRRAAPEELPKEPHTVDFFELHAFMIETQVLQGLELVPMVVREHVDLGLQLHREGVPIWCEPSSVVVFDNIHTRPTLADIRFFSFRWAEQLIDESHELFERRWGYRFYNEQFMQNWAFRRRVFSWFRYAGAPARAADLASRAAVRLLRPPVPQEFARDPLPDSRRALGEVVARAGQAAAPVAS